MYTVSSINWIFTTVIGVLFLAGRVHGANRARLFGILSIVKVTVQSSNCLFADALLIWRGWVICRRDNRVLVLPGICLLGLLATIIPYYVQCYSNFDLITGDDLRTTYLWARSPPLRSWGIATLAFTSMTNLSMTGLISFKLIRHQRRMRNAFGYSAAWIESLVIIESGALYSLAFLVYLVLYICHQDSQVIILDLVSQLAGIVPTVIIVTVAAGLSPIGEKTPRPPVIATTVPQAHSQSMGQIGGHSVTVDGQSTATVVRENDLKSAGVSQSSPTRAAAEES
ncbi:hypothetical protein HGRIS_011514 [Hohenbuehelia grisea]